MKSRFKTIIALSIIPQVLLVKLLSNFPEFIETYYSNGLYQFTSKLLRYIFGWLPFSFGDLFYTGLGLYALRWVIINRKRIIKDTKFWIRDLLIGVSFVYFTFYAFWGLNYFRNPLHKTMNLQTDYTTEELISVLNKLTPKVNTIHRSIVDNDTLQVKIPYEKDELMMLTKNGFSNLGQVYPFLNSQPLSVKASLYRLPLTYMGYGGYFNPISNEAQVNTLGPLHKIPTTSCHEQAHQIGYAAENEANFIGSLAAMYNDDTFIKYSGYIFALKHCLLELARRDSEMYDQAITQINSGVLKSYQEEYEFWQAHQNPLEPLFKSTYNQFLKINNQDKGIESYSYVVALLVNYFNTENNQMLN